MHTEARSSPTASETTAPGPGFNPADALASIDRRLRPVDFVVMAVLLAGVGAGVVAYVTQLRKGLAVTGMSDIFSWGVYVVNFVFFIGVSMAGTLISAVLRLTNAPWRRPITRLAEAITVFSLLIAGPMIIIDMGRPDRFLYVLIHARVQSPIIWDVLSLTTYLAGSILYLYVPMLPDLAFLRDRPGTGGWRRRLYNVLALGWRGGGGNAAQRRALERGVAVLAIVIIPVAISIHTVTAWLFGMTLRPGWHSTIIGPDFVIGALYSGMAGVITAMAVFRQGCRLHAFITVEHFRRLGLLMLVFGLIYGYFMVNEYLGAGYIGERSENRHVWEIMRGRYAGPFWGMVVIGLVLPLSILLAPRLRHIGWIVAASVLVNIGMWIKRWVIIVPTLANPFMPPLEAKQLVYTPTWVEWCITLGAFSTFALLYLGFARLFPIVSLWEMAEAAPAPAAPAVPAPDSASASARPARAATAVPVILAALLVATGARAQTPTPTATQPPPAASQPAAAPTQAAVVLSITSEEGKRMVMATVTADGKPVESATVRFGVQRTFGRLILGEETTLDDGTAAVAFPEGLPGDSSGGLAFSAEVTAPADLAGRRAELLMPGPQPATTTPNVSSRGLVDGDGAESAPSGLPRTLWAPRPPTILLATVGGIVVVVWSSYAFVVSLLWRIWKERNVQQ